VIKIKIVKMKDIIQRVDVIGHADYAAKGCPDLVCCAVSITIQNAYYSLIELIGARDVKGIMEVGNSYVEVRDLNLPTFEQVIRYAILKACEISLNMLAVEYPNNIMIEEVEL